MEQEQKKPSILESAKKEKQFKVSNFAWQFKIHRPTPLVAVNGVYIPRDDEEVAFLKHQVSQGRINYE